MSIKLMNAVWELPYPDSEKIVMLALADQANDSGHCWPSIATIARRCSKSERTVQASIRKLEAGGHLTRYDRAGTSSMYRLHPKEADTPATAAPLQPDDTPATAAPGGCNDCTPTPATAAPHPRNGCTQTTIEPSVEPPLKQKEEEEGEEAPDLFRLGGKRVQTDGPRYVMEVWNTMATAAGLAKCIKLTEARRKKLDARIKDYGAEPLADAIRAIPTRPFLMGKGPRGWKADIDFILRPDSAAKIMEGKYGDGDRRSGWAWVHD